MHESSTQYERLLTGLLLRLYSDVCPYAKLVPSQVTKLQADGNLSVTSSCGSMSTRHVSHSNTAGLLCRWETIGTSLPLKLELVNLATNTIIARLKGAASTPWSKDQYVLMVIAGQYGPTWLQVLAASAVSEAQRVNGKFSSSGFAATLAAM